MVPRLEREIQLGGGYLEKVGAPAGAGGEARAEEKGGVSDSETLWQKLFTRALRGEVLRCVGAGWDSLAFCKGVCDLIGSLPHPHTWQTIASQELLGHPSPSLAAPCKPSCSLVWAVVQLAFQTSW